MPVNLITGVNRMISAASRTNEQGYTAQFDFSMTPAEVLGERHDLWGTSKGLELKPITLDKLLNDLKPKMAQLAEYARRVEGLRYSQRVESGHKGQKIYIQTQTTLYTHAVGRIHTRKI